MRRAAGWQLLYRGSQGITVTNLQASNGLQRIEYDGPFNLGTAHDGYYLYEVTMEWVAGHDPATLAFDTDGGQSVQASGQVALFQAKAEAVYDGVNNLGAVGLRIPAYAGAGSDTHIGDVVWRSDRAQDNDGASNVRFEGIAGTGISGSGGSISARVEIWFISSGAGSAGAHIPNSISTLFGFDSELPLATSYQVGTAVMIDEGSQRGVWRNRDEVIEGTGLGLAGLTFDYQYDAEQVTHGDRTWHVFARNNFALADYPGVNFAAHGDFADWPAELEFIAFGYLTQGRSDGRIYIGFNADQSATNNVQFTTGGAGIAVVRQTNRLWRSASISAAQVGHIRQGVWAFTEPNATGARHTQRWHKIAGGGTLTNESLSAAVSLADPTGDAVVDANWTDIFTHTVTAAEAGHMFLTANVFATVDADSDEGGNRPLLAARIIKGDDELGRNYRYFRFTDGEPLDCVLSEILAVAEGDVLKVQAQFARLSAAATTLNAEATTESHWSRFSLPG